MGAKYLQIVIGGHKLQEIVMSQQIGFTEALDAAEQLDPEDRRVQLLFAQL